MSIKTTPASNQTPFSFGDRVIDTRKISFDMSVGVVMAVKNTTVTVCYEIQDDRGFDYQTVFIEYKWLVIE